MATPGSKSEQMSALIKLWRDSGMTKKLFCETQSVNIHTFTYWIDKERDIESSGSFMEIKPQWSGKYIEFLFPKGAVLRMDCEVSMAELSLLKTLLY
jgi:hypothetical protein